MGLGFESMIFLGKTLNSVCGRQMFGTCNDLLRLISHRHMHNVGFSALAVDYSNSSMVAPVGHAFVDGWFN